ncbi:MAG: hypothetical protein Q8N84_01940 [bacterium]|nr:hypothetical protein [bacterium]
MFPQAFGVYFSFTISPKVSEDNVRATFEQMAPQALRNMVVGDGNGKDEIYVLGAFTPMTPAGVMELYSLVEKLHSTAPWRSAPVPFKIIPVMEYPEKPSDPTIRGNYVPFSMSSGGRVTWDNHGHSLAEVLAKWVDFERKMSLRREEEMAEERGELGGKISSMQARITTLRIVIGQAAAAIGQTRRFVKSRILREVRESLEAAL